jgi:hypothetical protein
MSFGKNGSTSDGKKEARRSALSYLWLIIKKTYDFLNWLFNKA